jgi:hypothetical protein
MGIIDKTKEIGKKGVYLGVKAGKKGFEVGRKGVGATKERLRTKTCSECTHYEQIDDSKGNCPIAGERLSTANVSICPQRAFSAR